VKTSPDPSPETKGHKAARLVALVITVASGLALLPLIVALVSTLSFLGAADTTGYGELVTGWLLAACVAALWNIFVGLRAVEAPSWRRTARLAAPTATLLVIALIFVLAL
jgi:hypothetical protein